MENILTIKNLKASVKETKILSGIDLSVKHGEIHAIMGPNGSGKSSLALSVMGHPKYKITDGSIAFENKDVTSTPVHKRAQAGIFLAFQTPYEIEGVTLKEFLYQICSSRSGENFEQSLEKNLKLLNIKPEMLNRSLNVGFSGGEKKQIETLQIAMLKPKLIILDEIDSGLDVDALKIICNTLKKLKEKNQNTSILVITHYPRILHHLEPDFVHIMKDGAIVQSGTKELAYKIEREGYNKQS